MTILIDRPRWSWRDQRWSHLASDTDAAELHEFASAMGLRRLAFQGDHYDLPESRLSTALRRGAILVDSRELVRRLRASGLRHRPAMGWQPVLEWADHTDDRLDRLLAGAADVPARIREEIASLTGPLVGRAVVVLRRPLEWGVGVTTQRPPVDRRPHHWVVHNERGHHIDWFVPSAP